MTEQYETTESDLKKKVNDKRKELEEKETDIRIFITMQAKVRIC